MNIRARWEGDHGLQEASVTSLSNNGCYVLSGGTVETKELIRLEIILPDEASIYMWGAIVEVADEIGFALQFTSLEEADRERLGQFLQELLIDAS